MRRVFVDNSYLVAILNPRDDRHQKAKEVSQSLGNYLSVTSEMVLTEFLNHFCARGSSFRQLAITATDKLCADPDVEIIPQTTEQVKQARLFYRKRLDKEYSLTDCVSMLIMEKMGIQDVLTHDRHFQQAGFCALLRDD
ncbi:type II toxin-antitoxin system VapC family toxin [Leptolyngbyaceae cyanobacterium UHCC 1019]